MRQTDAFRGAFGQSPSEWRDRHTMRALRLRTGGTATALTAAGSIGQTTGEQLRTDTGTDPPVRTPAVPAATRPVHPLQPMIDWMRRHASSPLDLRSIAKHAAVSRRTLNRQFRLHLNTTPLALLAMMRVEHAKGLLESTTLPVDRIAEQCGFGSYASPRYHFTRIAGVSPHHYRHGQRPTRSVARHQRRRCSSETDGHILPARGRLTTGAPVPPCNTMSTGRPLRFNSHGLVPPERRSPSPGSPTRYPPSIRSREVQ